MADAVTARIMRHEGCRLQVYDDATGLAIRRGTLVKGNPTIGWGSLIALPGGITWDEADAMLRARVAQARTDAATLPVYSALDAVRQGVLVEMVYQMGVTGVRGFVRALAALARQDWGAAADEMLSSVWARQTPARANVLAKIMQSGVDDGGGS